MLGLGLGLGLRGLGLKSESGPGVEYDSEGGLHPDFMLIIHHVVEPIMLEVRRSDPKPYSS